MAITYSLAPEPKWAMIDNLGTLAGGAKLYTKSNVNRSLDKAVYQDALGLHPYTNPIIFDANGTQGPMYWEVDSTDLDDTYYLEAYTADDNFLWDVQNFTAPEGGGGGGGSTSVNLRNYITNNSFLYHNADSPSPINAKYYYICPSNHVGFPQYSTDAQLIQINDGGDHVGYSLQDIWFVKNSITATDTIVFEDIPPSQPFLNDVNPLTAIRYTSNAVSGETAKGFQFPISQNVYTLENQAVTVSFWGKLYSGNPTLQWFVLQDYGEGASASPTQWNGLGGSITLTAGDYVQHTVTLTIPAATGTRGECGNDALYLNLQMPIGFACDIAFSKPSVYLGTVVPSKEFETYDQSSAITMSPRTGDRRSMFGGPVFPTGVQSMGGWIALVDGQKIALDNTHGIPNYMGAQYFPLYKFLWDNISNTYCPIFPAGARVGSAETNFEAGIQITLPTTGGRVDGASGTGTLLTARAVGETNGSEITQLLNHTHTIGSAGFAFVAAFEEGIPGSVTTQMGGGAQYRANTIGPIPTTNDPSGGSATPNNLQPTTFMKWYIKV